MKREQVRVAASCLVLLVYLLSVVVGPAVATVAPTSVATREQGTASNVGTNGTAANVGTDGTVTVMFANESVVQRRNDAVFLWRHNRSTIAVNVTDVNASYLGVCLDATDDRSATNATGDRNATTLGCKKQYVDSREYVLIERFEIDDWPKNATGAQTLTASVADLENDKRVLATANRSIVVVTHGGDYDDDKLSNAREVELGTGLNQTDTDTDGISDGVEVTEYGTDPLRADTDGDGLRDGMEVRSGTNATKSDTDGDGIDDGPEVHEYDTNPTRADTDRDGLEDGPEVHVYDTNPNEPDTDGDGFDDALEVSMGSNPRSALTLLGALTAVGIVLALSLVAVRRSGFGRGIGGNRNGPQPPESADRETERDEIQGSTVPPTVLSDEDRVKRLLEEANGRLPQTDIVEKTDWSKSKVSRLISSMEEDGLVSKIAVGRQNIIALDGQVPANAKSPFEETEQRGED